MKKRPRHLRPSARMVWVNSCWPVGRDGTGTKENGTHHGDKIRQSLQVKDGGKKARNGRESEEFGGKRVMEAVEDNLENCAHVKVDIEVLESLLEPENLEVSVRYVLKYSTTGGKSKEVSRTG